MGPVCVPLCRGLPLGCGHRDAGLGVGREVRTAMGLECRRGRAWAVGR